MIPVIVKLCESPSKAGGLLMIKLTHLRKEVDHLRMEREILKKAAGIAAKELQ